MFPQSSLFRFLAFLALLACLRVGVTQAAPVAAGQVIVASGDVQAVAGDGQARELRRRSPFFAGDTIRTGPGAQVQLRFADGALMSLREDSELRVDDYRFQNAGGEGDRSMATLVKGGLRTITGAIGKQDPEAYRVVTPVATIGIRGTHYEAVLESPQSLALASWQGGIEVRNTEGALRLGVGADFNFGRVSAGVSPQGLLQPPAVLQVPAPVGRRAPLQRKAPLAADADGTELADGEAERTSPADGATTQSDVTLPMPGDDPALVGEDKPPLSPLRTALNSPLSPATMLDCATCPPPPQLVLDTSSDLPLAADLRFTPTEWQALKDTHFYGVIVEANTSPAFGFKGGRALYHGSASPLFTDKGFAPYEPEFATAPYQAVIRRGAASVDAFSSYTVDAGHTVYWGTWNGSVNPVETQTSATDPSVKALSFRPHHWGTLLPTEPAVMAAKTGSINMNTVLVAHGGGSGGGPLTPANVTFNANVNFDTGAITAGNIGINNGPETWSMNFSGQVRGNIFDAEIDSGSSTVFVSPGPAQAAQGNMGLAFTGSSGQAVGGAFNFQAIGNPATHVEGILLVQ